MLTHPSTRTVPDGIRGKSLIALSVVVAFWALIMVDEMVISISLAGIGQALEMSQTQLSWVVNAYLLPYGGLLLLGGRAGDILGKRRVFVAGVAFYTAGCLVRAIAPDAWLVIAARGAQGVGAALATPCVLALIVSMFEEGPLRRRAISAYTIAGGAGAAVGLMLVGLLGTISSWRVVLLPSAVFGLVLLVLGPMVIEETPRRPGRFDFAGALSATLGVVAIVYGLTTSQGGDWLNGWVIGSVVAGLVLLGLFVLISRRARQPLLDLGLFTDRSRVGAYLVLMITPGAQIGLFFYLSQYFQIVLGYDTLTTAFAFLAVSVGMTGAASLAVRLEPRIGGRMVVLIGAVLLLISNAWLLRMDIGDGYWTGVLPSLVLVGAGVAMAIIPAFSRATSGVESEDAGAASSVVSMVQNVGSSLALAVIVVIATAASTRATEHPPAGLSKAALDGYVFSQGMQATFLTGAGFAVAALLAALLIGRSRTS
ncbi:MFS transporter [Microbispora sp. H10670]|uniref:MFS transporter n=1 Tax=Microbispora sp. H10670 TaxID=2729108 RepID=UPI001602FEBE|nr:MFS transporter [Microbispora sp. H10670]